MRNFTKITVVIITLLVTSCTSNNYVARSKQFNYVKKTQQKKPEVATNESAKRKIIFNNSDSNKDETRLVTSNTNIDLNSEAPITASNENTSNNNQTENGILSNDALIEDNSIENSESNTELLESSPNNSNNQESESIISDNPEPKVEPLGLTGFIIATVGFFIFPIGLGLIGLIFSAISLHKITKNSDKYKGRGFAIAGLTIGLVVFILGIVILAAA